MSICTEGPWQRGACTAVAVPPLWWRAEPLQPEPEPWADVGPLTRRADGGPGCGHAAAAAARSRIRGRLATAVAGRREVARGQRCRCE